MAKTESISDERIEGWISQLIDAARWQGNARSMGYAAGDPAKVQDDKDVEDAKAGLLATIEALRAANSDGGVEPVNDDDNASKWRDNVEAMLSSGDPDVIRCHEGGGPESLIGSLVLTMMRTRNSRDRALPHPPAKALDGIAVTQEMVEAALGAIVIRVATVGEYIDFNAADAVNFGVLEEGEKFHALDIIREDQMNDCQEIIMRAALEAALAVR